MSNKPPLLDIVKTKSNSTSGLSKDSHQFSWCFMRTWKQLCCMYSVLLNVIMLKTVDILV